MATGSAVAPSSCRKILAADSQFGPEVKIPSVINKISEQPKELYTRKASHPTKLRTAGYPLGASDPGPTGVDGGTQFSEETSLSSLTTLVGVRLSLAFPSLAAIFYPAQVWHS